MKIVVFRIEQIDPGYDMHVYCITGIALDIYILRVYEIKCYFNIKHLGLNMQLKDIVVNVSNLLFVGKIMTKSNYLIHF